MIRTTIHQVGAMTDVARQKARTQKQRIDTAFLERRRREALAELGEILYALAAAGEIEIDELPELAQAVQDVEEIDRRIAEAEKATAGGPASGERRPVILRPTGSGSGPRERGRDRDRGRERVWRPTLEQEPLPERDTGIEVDFATPAPRGRPPNRERGDGGGGIVFVDDDSAPADVDPADSLHSYMHEDDIPRRR